MKDAIIAVSRIDAGIFRRFAYFDTYRLKKRYRAPLGFLVIMVAFALICLFAAGDKPQAKMIGAVLLAVGVLLPLAYFLMFELSVRAQTRGMKQPRKAYTLTLSDEREGLRIANDKEQVKLAWNKVYGAYRLPGCIYLYVHPSKAFLLPDGQASVSPDEVFTFLREHIGEKRTQDCRRSKVQPIRPDDGAMR